MLLVFALGQDFFPSVDAGQMRLHVRGRAGLRVEETARLCDQVEAYLRTQIPKEELVTILDNIGLPNSGINLSYSNSGVIGTSDAEILVGLNQEHHHPTAGYIRKLRKELPRQFPGVEFFFQPADIVSQILNFGLPAPIDIQLIGADMTEQLRHRAANCEPHSRDSRHRRRPCAAAARSADAAPGYRAQSGDASGHERARRGAERAGFAERQLPDCAKFLAESRPTA